MTKPAETLLTEIHDFIDQQQQKLNRGEDIEVAGLEREIASLCQQVQSMASEDAQKYKARLESLFKELSELGNQLIHHHAAVAQQISSLSLRQKATVAYMKSEMMDPKKENE